MLRKHIALWMLCLLCTGCVSSSYIEGYGQQRCIGLTEDKDPRFVYKISVWNLTIAVIFVELVVPPVVVLANALQCPTAAKVPQEKTGGVPHTP